MSCVSPPFVSRNGSSRFAVDYAPPPSRRKVTKLPAGVEQSEDRCLVNSQWSALVGAVVPQFVGPTQAEIHVAAQVAHAALGDNSSLQSDLASDSVSSRSLSHAAATSTWDTLSTKSSSIATTATTSVSHDISDLTLSDESQPVPQLVNPALPSTLASNLTAALFGNALFDAFDDFSPSTGTTGESAARPLSRASSDDSSVGHGSGAGSVYSVGHAEGVAGPASGITAGSLADPFASPSPAYFGGVAVAPRAAAADGDGSGSGSDSGSGTGTGDGSGSGSGSCSGSDTTAPTISNVTLPAEANETETVFLSGTVDDECSSPIAVRVSWG